jgi:hypothetical protein
MLGEEGDWLLWSRFTINGWHNFAVQPPAKINRKIKSVFYGAWNGERLAGSRDMGLLAEHHPDIYFDLEKRCPTIEWDFDE